MGFIRYEGRVYGIMPIRKLTDSILLNLPLINLIYTKKIRISITKRERSGAPVCGIFTYTRIYKNEKSLPIKFMVPEVFMNVLITAYDIDDCMVFEHKELDKLYFPSVKYEQLLKAKKSN